jgi:nitrate reductase NapE component
VALLLAPAVAAKLFPAILAPALVGEGAFCLWLLVKGVDQSAWERRLVD